jgi:hypothetical protein
MKLETHGKNNLGKITRHYEIIFFMNDLIKHKEVKVECCPTERMIGDYMTKPLTRRKFISYQKKIMNFETVGQQ